MKKRKPNKIKITFWICVIILILYLSRTSNSQTKFNEDSTQNNFEITKQDSNENYKGLNKDYLNYLLDKAYRIVQISSKENIKDRPMVTDKNSFYLI